MPGTRLTGLAIVETRVVVRFAELQTRLLNHLRSKPPGHIAGREELASALWADGCPNLNRVDQVVFKTNRRRSGTLINHRGRGWSLDPSAEFRDLGA